ncbi:cytochrome b562 [Actinobacillus porcinus]|uniref:cytochrome b562 n=1 Tax=Actinobacillus porcinus TaxID=51048 RepID=UPI00235214F6|nr:cytochrome b562 [Actinobacillus porcinus]MCI5764983.1 cytochrome b562 [Actinobacillus porcinus]MDD7544880.1 cytochrome b562 [Actinobacillus porcinus]MDY5421404.1 cytochrome b562 [Actinobacillus porcinus]MDY5849002.1 cytochrome b562 [Actinobacillus porcinus]
MKKFWTLFSIVTLAFVAACDNGSNVKAEMGQMSLAVNKLTDAKTTDEFHQAAMMLRDASLQAMAKQPSSIKNAEDFKGYQAGMQQFIDALDQADALAQQGDLDEAKRATQRLFELKKEFHVKYK